uniref:Ubiquitin-conjugating enzyme E2 Q2 n=1 Tax=Aceria tosichella TaxID=561515 RepID=A0A6G1SKQ4_9ACAR
MSQFIKLPSSIRMPPVIALSVILLVLVVSTSMAQATRDQEGKRSGSTRASKRLMKEYREVQETDSYKNGVFTVELVDDNIYKWHVKLYRLAENSAINRDLQKAKERGEKGHILLEILYGDNYPLSPPFVRVVYPNIYSSAMIGHGGIFCSQLLTEKGWSSSYTIEPLILQLSATLVEGVYHSIDFKEPNYTYEQAQRRFKFLEINERWSMPDTS